MSLQDKCFFILGLGFLALAKAKNTLKGYTSPKPFGITEFAKCIEYDIRVVEYWSSYLQEYTHNTTTLCGKNVLELGPGSDIGTGIYLLAKGVFQYNACDVNDLISSTPDSFYDHLFKKMEGNITPDRIEFLKEQLEKAKTGHPSRLNYVIRDDFDFTLALGNSTIDLVFSQAAFEHFDDIETTISQLSTVCKPGAILVLEIDLKTHSRWIRDKDPNNIYRYPNWVYNFFWFRGIPNRVRPFQYKEVLERSGWTDISITPLKKLIDHDTGSSGMNRNYSDKKNQMDYLSIILCARKNMT